MYQPGDILAFSGPGFVSNVIKAVTLGSVSHVGIVSDHEHDLAMFESTTLAAGGAHCIIQKELVKGVQAHWTSDIRMRPGKIWLYRPTRPLSDRERKRLHYFLLGQIGKDYDYAGAMASGPRLLRWASWLFKDECMNSVFCSELVAAAYERLLRFEIRSASVYNPNNLLRRLVRWGAVQKPERIQ